MYKGATQISTILSFITQIQRNSYDPDYTYFYRGHSDYTYRMEPSIYRNDGHIKNEDVMIKELITHNPKEFVDCKNTIDFLVKMQHYGLPTRLLDITTNPLIALFFACEDASQDRLNFKKGEVIVFKVPNSEIKYFDSDTVAILSNLSKMKYEFTYKKIFNRQKFNEQPNLSYLLHAIKQEKNSFHPNIEMNHLKSVLCVKAKMENPRMVNQSGAFFLFGCGHSNKEFVEIKKDWIVNKQRWIIINKKEILSDLKIMGITEKFIYPSLEKYSDFLKQTYFEK